MKYIFFTKTDWLEPPRLRHQLARLLADAGHEIIFFQKPKFIINNYQYALDEKGIKLTRHSELIHHRLRLARVLCWLNSLWVMRSIKNILIGYPVSDDVVIVNFNYDYYFLRRLFKKNKIILIINDDFISTFGKIFKNYAGSIQKETCQISNRILTVSTYLQRQLGDDCKPELFLPWSNSTYKKPIGGVKRDTLLLWGYINQKIDFNLINNMAKQLGKADKNLRILIVGPVHRVEQEMDHLCKGYANVETLPATSLNELPIDRCFGAIIPYKSGIPWNDAIMLPNKALHLLSRGMPLLISGMPEFIKAQFIFRIDTDSTVGTVLEIRDKFSQFQSDIESFVKCNSAKKRLEQFMNIT